MIVSQNSTDLGMGPAPHAAAQIRWVFGNHNLGSQDIYDFCTETFEKSDTLFGIRTRYDFPCSETQAYRGELKFKSPREDFILLTTN